MDRFIINGGARLCGRVRLAGSKNSALAIIAAGCLARGKSVLENVPDNLDTRVMCDILNELGATARFTGPGILEIDGTGLSGVMPSYELVRRLRASFYTAGLLLARLGEACVPFPGGDAIGARGIDFHLNGFRALGADVSVEHGYVKINASELRGCNFYVGKASHGTTVNMMLAACAADGTTVLENAAKDPEIVDLAIFLNNMGARVRGAGTSTIRIEGTRDFSPTRHEVIPDRLEAGTYAMAAAATGGCVSIENAVPEHLRAVIVRLEEAGSLVEEGPYGLRITSPRRPRAASVETYPYPGFPTDLQPQYVALMSRACGMCAVTETRFESRFGYIDELRRMGADLQVDRDTVIVKGVERLTGATVESPRDIRGGAALVLAGLAAEGETEIRGVENIDRGYDHIETKLRGLGARVERVSD